MKLEFCRQIFEEIFKYQIYRISVQWDSSFSVLTWRV